MRLLLAMPDTETAGEVRGLLYAMDETWEIAVVPTGVEALHRLREECWDVLLLHAGVRDCDGAKVLRNLWERPLLCPPRILFLWDGQEPRAGIKADCVAPCRAEAGKLCSLLNVLAKKPLPMLAAAYAKQIFQGTTAFLDALSMSRALKGREYLHWMLCRCVPSPWVERSSMGQLCQACAGAFHTTPSAVERCLRVAIENVFTQGSIGGIERYFGTTVDPERGKPTNRAFLLQATRQLRLLLDGGALGEKQRDTPQSRRAYDGVNDPADHGALAAEEPCN